MNFDDTIERADALIDKVYDKKGTWISLESAMLCIMLADLIQSGAKGADKK